MHDQEISFIRNRQTVPVRQGIYVLRINAAEDQKTGLIVLDKKPHVGSAVALETLTIVTYSKTFDNDEDVFANEYSNEQAAKKDGWRFIWSDVRRQYVVNDVDNEGPSAPDPDDDSPVNQIVVETNVWNDHEKVLRDAIAQLMEIAIERVDCLNKFYAAEREMREQMARRRIEEPDGLIVIDAEAQRSASCSDDEVAEIVEFNRLFPMPGTVEASEFGPDKEIE